MNEQPTLQSIARLLDRVTEEVGGLKAEMATLKSELTQIKAHAHDVEARIDRLEAGGAKMRKPLVFQYTTSSANLQRQLDLS
jgi:capsule polysaccharide export protein KpsE/RkpR